MLKLYGSALSSPTNKVRYCCNYLGQAYELQEINLGAGEQKKPEYLKINPCGRIPAIDDEGFKLFESNAIMRYLSDKQKSSLYPQDVKQRALVDQWMDFAAQHVATATSRIMWNTYFYKFVGVPIDERSLQDGKNFLSQYLPVLEQQLAKNAYMAGNAMTLADISVLSALDVCELIQVDLSAYSHVDAWRKKLMSEKFYQSCHKNFAQSFDNAMSSR